MAAGAADNIFFRGMFEGSIGNNMEIQRRPYHKNCGCALHDGRNRCPHSVNNVSFSVRRTKSEGCLALAAAAATNSSGSFNSSPVSPGLQGNSGANAHSGMGNRRGSLGRLLEVCDEDDDQLIWSNGKM